jgi:quinol monooxygenase YgiN
MMICLAVRLLAKPGMEQKIAEAFRPLIEASRKEPGCLMYVVHQRKDEPQKFLVYEQYKDEPALDAHRNSEHFKKYATNGVYTMIDERDAGLYHPLD